MYLLRYLLLAALTASSAHAASYQKNDGTLVEPIQSAFDDGVHSYSGPNLAPEANLTGANLSEALLISADLEGADLRDADLSFTNLNFVNLSGANLRGADLSFTSHVGTVTGSPYYDEGTNFFNAWTGCPECGGSAFLFNPVTAGWTLVPEPTSLLLALLGLVFMPLYMRHNE